MNNKDLIKAFEAIKKDADKLHSGNVAHQRTHIAAAVQWYIDELTKNDDLQKKEIIRLAFEKYPRLINDPYNPIEDDNKELRDIWMDGYSTCESNYEPS